MAWRLPTPSRQLLRRGLHNGVSHFLHILKISVIFFFNLHSISLKYLIKKLFTRIQKVKNHTWNIVYSFFINGRFFFVVFLINRFICRSSLHTQSNEDDQESCDSGKHPRNSYC